MKSIAVNRNPLPLVAAAALLMVCVLVTTGARADTEADKVVSETVKYEDLKLENPAEVQVLYTRIHAAARRVCSDTRYIGLIAESHCIAHAEASAIGKVNVPALSAYYRAKMGRRAQPLSASR